MADDIEVQIGPIGELIEKPLDVLLGRHRDGGMVQGKDAATIGLMQILEIRPWQTGKSGMCLAARTVDHEQGSFLAQLGPVDLVIGGRLTEIAVWSKRTNAVRP